MTDLEQKIAEAMTKHCVAMEGLTMEQLASVVAQAIACGDIARYTAPPFGASTDPLTMTITDRSQVVYIPHAMTQRLRDENDRLWELLRKIRYARDIDELSDLMPEVESELEARGK
jgi:hypothetical protein